jgi:hypothetical protein
LSIAGRGSITALLASLLYLVLRRLLTLVAPNHRSDDAAQIEILVLRYQFGILRRQVKRPGTPDRGGAAGPRTAIRI